MSAGKIAVSAQDTIISAQDSDWRANCSQQRHVGGDLTVSENFSLRVLPAWTTTFAYGGFIGPSFSTFYTS